MSSTATAAARVAPASGPADQAPRRLRPAAWALAPALAFMMLFFIVPLSALVAASFRAIEPGTTSGGGFTLSNYAALLTDAHSLKIMWASLRVSLQATVVCLGLGYPLAVLMASLARTRPRLQVALLVVVFAPLFVGVVVRAFAWTVLLRSDGVINNLLLWSGIVNQPVRLLFTEAGLVLAMTHVFLPLMVLPIASVIQKIDPNLDEAAQTLGATPLRRFFKVLLPLSVPGICAGAALVFCMCISAYVIPTLVAGSRVLVMPITIARRFMVTMDWAQGAAAAVLLVAMTIAVVLANEFIVQGRRAARSGT